MKITFITVGKIKEKFFKDAISEYEKRLKKYCKLSIIEVDDEKTPEQASLSLKDAILEKEAQKILHHLKSDAYIISLEINGKIMDSESFATHINQQVINGKSHIQFIIGGSLGLHQSLSGKADLKLSFSAMTFPHQLMRVILIEQVYRAFRINKGEPYHK